MKILTSPSTQILNATLLLLFLSLRRSIMGPNIPGVTCSEGRSFGVDKCSIFGMAKFILAVSGQYCPFLVSPVITLPLKKQKKKPDCNNEQFATQCYFT